MDSNATLTCDALIFDMDGVLVDSSKVIERSWLKWARHHKLDESAVLPLIHGRRAIEVVRAVAPHLDAAAELVTLVDQEVNDAEGPLTFAGVQELLTRLPQGRWAIATSAPRVIASGRLRQCGLPEPDVFVCAEDVSKSKPSPEGFLKAAAALGIAARRCVVVEDSLPGIAAGLAAEMAVIGVATTHAVDELGKATVRAGRFSDIAVEFSGGAFAISVRPPGTLP